MFTHILFIKVQLFICVCWKTRVNVFGLRMLERWLNITINERFGCGRHCGRKDGKILGQGGGMYTLGKWFREVGYK